MTEDQRTEAIVAAILLAGGNGSEAGRLLDFGEGNMYERSVLAARRLMLLTEAKTVVPEEPGGVSPS
jgi:hypothetical protein